MQKRGAGRYSVFRFYALLRIKSRIYIFVKKLLCFLAFYYIITNSMILHRFCRRLSRNTQM